MQHLSRQSRIALREGMTAHFSNEELEILCFDLGVIYENLPSRTLGGKVKDLILFYERTGGIEALVERCAALRPNVLWRQLLRFEEPDKAQSHLQNQPSLVGSSGEIHAVYGGITNVTINITYLGQNLAEELSEIAKFAKPLLPEAIELSHREPRLFQVPPFPAHLVGRSKEIALIRKALISRNTPGPMVIAGMAGVGKTVLSIAVAYDPDLIRAFPDGIMWASGPNLEANLVVWLTSLQSQAHGNSISPQSIPSLLLALKEAVSNRRILMIIDAIDEIRDVAPILSFAQALSGELGNKSRILITSRNVGMANAAHTFALDVLPEKEALELFVSKLDGQLPDGDSQTALEIVQLCGYHPVAISWVAGMVKTFDYTSKEIRNRLVHQYAINDSGVAIDTLRTITMDTLLQQSAEALSADLQRKFRQMAVFGLDEFDLKAATSVWQSSEADASWALQQFLQRSLLESKDGFYRIHPLVSRYIKNLFSAAAWDERATTTLAYTQHMRLQDIQLGNL